MLFTIYEIYASIVLFSTCKNHECILFTSAEISPQKWGIFGLLLASKEHSVL